MSFLILKDWIYKLFFLLYCMVKVFVIFGVLLFLGIFGGCFKEDKMDSNKLDLSDIEASESTCVYDNRSKVEKQKEIDEILKDKELSLATFAGGCFWCVESDFEKIDGVVSAISGYTGGNTSNPSYKEVISGRTGHYEAVKVYFDEDVVSYGELVDVFFKHIDPTDDSGQFADKGSQYKPAVFYHGYVQKGIVEKYIKNLDELEIFEDKVVVEVKPAVEFYLAEEYHQNYSQNNKINYNLYREGSGRNAFLRNVWKGKEDIVILNESEERNLKEELTPLQYHITQEGGTERPFDNEFWNHKEKGIYVDVVSGEPLFSSTDKFDSGTGWPSFSKPIDKGFIEEKEDLSFGMKRVEVKSSTGSHLGHVFDDGPQELGGERFCINSGSLKFIAKENLTQEGYGEYLKLFE